MITADTVFLDERGKWECKQAAATKGSVKNAAGRIANLFHSVHIDYRFKKIAARQDRQIKALKRQVSELA